MKLLREIVRESAILEAADREPVMAFVVDDEGHTEKVLPGSRVWKDGNFNKLAGMAKDKHRAQIMKQVDDRGRMLEKSFKEKGLSDKIFDDFEEFLRKNVTPAHDIAVYEDEFLAVFVYKLTGNRRRGNAF